MSIDNSDDVIDSCDVIARIEELETERAELADEANNLSVSAISRQPTLVALKQWDDDNGAELDTLKELAEEAEGCDTLIRDSYFKAYAMELAYAVGAIDRNAAWPLDCIDWDQAARELQMDYTSVEFDGVTYWAR